MKKLLGLFLLLFSFNNSYIFSCDYKVERKPHESEITKLFREYLKNTSPNTLNSCSQKEDFKGSIRVILGCKDKNEYAGNFKYFENNEFGYSILNFEEFIKKQNEVEKLKAIIYYPNVNVLTKNEIIQIYPYLNIIENIIVLQGEKMGLSKENIEISYAPKPVN